MEFLLALVLFVLTLPLLALAVAMVKLTSCGPAIYPAGPGRVSRKALHDLQDPHHGPRLRAPTGPRWATAAIRGSRRSAGSCADAPGRAAAALERAARRHEPGRPAAGAARVRARSWSRPSRTIASGCGPPGVTGLAQVQLPPDSDLDSVRLKLACDLFYIRGRSPRLDLKIVASTAMKMVGIPCSFSCRLLRIPTGDAVAEVYQNWPYEATCLTPA